MPVNFANKIVTDSLAAHWDSGTVKSYDPRENLLLRSNELSISPWSIAEYTYQNSSTGAPDGTLTGIRATNNSNNNNFNFNGQLISTTVGGIYTFSIHIKNIDATNIQIINGINNHSYNSGVHWVASSNSMNVYFDNASAIVGYGQADAGNGWTRIWISTDMTKLATYYSQTISTVSCAWYIGPPSNTSSNFNKSCFFWGAQHERSLGMSAYSATTTSQYTKSTTLIDLTGNGNNLTAQNFPVWSNSNGGYFRLPTLGYFSGTGNNTLPVKNSSYTLQAWVRYPTSSVINGGGILSIGTHSSTTGLYNSIRNLSVLGSFSNFWFGNNLDVSTNVANIVANQWYLITAVYYPFSLRRLYVNNTLIATDSPTENHDVPFNPALEIGRSANNTFGAEIGPCMVYRTALSADKINQNYNALRGRFNS